MKSKRSLSVFCLAFLTFVGPKCLADSDSGISYDRDIRPLLSGRCFACHGPDAQSREAGLRLDVPDGDEGAIGFAIEPGSVEDSELWNRITSDDESEIMPPPQSHLEPLDKDEQQLIRKWIVAGAPYEGFWAFKPPTRNEPPSVSNAHWSSHPIDQFVLAEIEANGMTPNAEADARTLIRRVTFDLTGLPPTRDEVVRFVEEFNADDDHAWERLIDELIDRPQFGEHVGRYWLDLVRFADSNGMHKDFYRNHIAYRDWVINAFNDNLGYDQFLKYQLAGDLYPAPSDEQLTASGFHRLHLIIDRGTALPEESFAKNVIDRVTSVGTAFLGLTVHCAQCHDHKYDPITQKDFYALSAFFNNLDAPAETVASPKNGLQAPFITLGSDEDKEKPDEWNRQLGELDKQIKMAKNDETKEHLQSQKTKIQKERDSFVFSVPHAMVMKERDEVRPTFILNRGEYDSPGEQVQRNTPQFLPPLKPTGEIPSRMDLADWFVDPENPLTARVAVNRFWQQFFGVGLVKTSEDLGNQGEVPSHPALLDYLAVNFVESGWDVKALMKHIVMSSTYRQSSIATPEIYQADSENRLLARGSRYRLDAEMIRDQILATSGLLSKKQFGPSVKPPQPDGLWKAVSMIGERYQSDRGESANRRSVYTFWKRSMPHPQLTILNAPFRDACTARRERTNTPLQALLLLNEPEYMKAAVQLASQTLALPIDQRIDFIWETVTAMQPDEGEKSGIQELVEDLISKYEQEPELADELCGDANPSDDVDRSELAAWTIVGNLLYSLDITKTKN